MSEESDKEKFDFNAEGESLGYISLAQASLLAIQTASQAPGEYGSRISGTALVFEVAETSEDEDFYIITLSVRLQGSYSGEPGREQLFISKEGKVEHRQVLNFLNLGKKSRVGIMAGIGVSLIGIIAVIGVIFMPGNGNDILDESGLIPESESTTVPTTTSASAPTKIPVVTVESTTNSTPMHTITPTVTVAPTTPPTAQPTSTPRPTPTPIQVATATPFPTSIPLQTPTPTPVPFDGSYTLLVDQVSSSLAGKVVSFRVGNLQADQTVLWQQGGSTNLNLTASSGRSDSSLGEGGKTFDPPTTRGGVLASPSLQRIPPHVFTGSARIDGRLVPEGTTISAWIDGISYGITTVKQVNFPTSTSATAVVFNPLGSNLLRVWRFSSSTNSWKFYVPGVAFFGVNTLTDVGRGDIVWLNVSNQQKFQGGTLFPGWNLISLD